jgi:RNA polymerase-binding transcription factor DksA
MAKRSTPKSAQSSKVDLPQKKSAAPKPKETAATKKSSVGTYARRPAAPAREQAAAPVQQPAPKPAVRYSDEELEEFRQIILAEREKTLDELRMLRERLEDLTNYETSEETGIYSMHMAEQGSEAYEREKTYAQIQRMTDYLRKLDEALKRIEDKTYGICRMCGILIAKERLRAVPITTLSASWKLRGKCPDDGIDRVGPDLGGE